MKKLILSALAAAFVLGIGASTLVVSKAYAGDEMIDCSLPENADNEACK
jgi:hypothetical protein